MSGSSDEITKKSDVEGKEEAAAASSSNEEKKSTSTKSNTNSDKTNNATRGGTKSRKYRKRGHFEDETPPDDANDGEQAPEDNRPIKELIEETREL